MNFQNPKTNQLWASTQISTNATETTLANAIRGYFNLVWGAPISVTKYMYDAAGNLTINQLASVKNVFVITV